MTTSRTDLLLTNRLLTIPDTADHLQCCTNTVRRKRVATARRFGC
ncbi:hypothetical protein [Thalassobaculum sp.]